MNQLEKVGMNPLSLFSAELDIELAVKLKSVHIYQLAVYYK